MAQYVFPNTPPVSNLIAPFLISWRAKRFPVEEAKFQNLVKASTGSPGTGGESLDTQNSALSQCFSTFIQSEAKISSPLGSALQALHLQFSADDARGIVGSSMIGRAIEKKDDFLASVYRLMQANDCFETDPNLNDTGNAMNQFYTTVLTYHALKTLETAEVWDLKKDLDHLIGFSDFKKAFQNSWWSRIDLRRIDVFCERIFFLVTYGAKQRMTVMEYVAVFVWLGDPDLLAHEAIPAELAVEFYVRFYRAHTPTQALYRGIMPRPKLKNFPAGTEPFMRLNEGRISWNATNDVVYMHRNFVLTDPQTKDGITHKLLFAYDAKTGVVKEADDSLRTRYTRRRNQRGSNNQSAGLDFRAILTQFNTEKRALPKVEKREGFTDLVTICAFACFLVSLTNEERLLALNQGVQGFLPVCIKVGSGRWNCNACKQFNDAVFTHCLTCRAPRPEAPPAARTGPHGGTPVSGVAAAAAATPTPSWLELRPLLPMGGAGPGPKPYFLPTWTCSRCSFENAGARTICDICGSRRH